MSKNDTIGAITCALPGMSPIHLGLMKDVANRLNQSEPKAAKWHTLIANAIQQPLTSGGHELALAATTGKRTFENAKDTLDTLAYVQFGLRDCCPNIPSVPTQRTEVEVHEMGRNNSTRDVFRGDTPPWFTQDQVITFIETHSNWLRAGDRATFFPLLVGSNALVARLIWNPYAEKLSVLVDLFSAGPIWWDAKICGRVVVQRLNSHTMSP